MRLTAGGAVTVESDARGVGGGGGGVGGFFFNDTATTEIYTLSLHDALPISDCLGVGLRGGLPG